MPSLTHNARSGTGVSFLGDDAIISLFFVQLPSVGIQLYESNLTSSLKQPWPKIRHEGQVTEGDSRV